MLTLAAGIYSLSKLILMPIQLWVCDRSVIIDRLSVLNMFGI